MVPLPQCDRGESRPYLEHLRSQRLLQFLMGLNESYNQIRSSILARTPIVTVNEAYAIVSKEESQRTLGVVDDKKEVVTLLAGKSQSYRPSPKKEQDSSNSPQRFELFCEYCGYRNHKKDNCYRLVGYPPGFQIKKRANNNVGAGHFRPNGGVQGDGSNSFGNNQTHATGIDLRVGLNTTQVAIGLPDLWLGEIHQGLGLKSMPLTQQQNLHHLRVISSVINNMMKCYLCLERKAHLNIHQI
ncbi:uncharacterized protein LOC129873769 [Solanum dulcamara]|uniref:uncharacterized protein LOC129873769 n=1 Tax=Solanum dulcamara TaxID=45834 RepID=UPI002486B0D3|nr:uncharacterized protein LOC129873769 [Solanum dulcamara]